MSLHFMEAGLPPHHNEKLYLIMEKHCPADVEEEGRLTKGGDLEIREEWARKNRARTHEIFAVVLRVELESAYIRNSAHVPEDDLLADLWRSQRVRQRDLAWMKEGLKELENTEGLTLEANALKLEIERGEKERDEASSDRPSERFADVFFYAFANYKTEPQGIDMDYYVLGPGAIPMPITAEPLQENDIEDGLEQAKRIYRYLYKHREGIEAEVGEFGCKVDCLVRQSSSEFRKGFGILVEEQKGPTVEPRPRWRATFKFIERLRQPRMAPPRRVP